MKHLWTVKSLLQNDQPNTTMHSLAAKCSNIFRAGLFYFFGEHSTPQAPSTVCKWMYLEGSVSLLIPVSLHTAWTQRNNAIGTPVILLKPVEQSQKKGKIS